MLGATIRPEGDQRHRSIIVADPASPGHPRRRPIRWPERAARDRMASFIHRPWVSFPAVSSIVAR